MCWGESSVCSLQLCPVHTSTEWMEGEAPASLKLLGGLCDVPPAPYFHSNVLLKEVMLPCNMERVINVKPTLSPVLCPGFVWAACSIPRERKLAVQSVPAVHACSVPQCVCSCGVRAVLVLQSSWLS